MAKVWFMVYGFNSLRGYYLKWPKYGLWFMVLTLKRLLLGLPAAVQG